MKFHATALREFGESLLTASGLAPERARDVAEILLEGDLLGHTTHGFALLPAYLNSLKHDAMERHGEPQVVADCDSSLTWDGNYLPGAWLVRRTINDARERLARHPVVTVVIRRSHHIGCLQAYLKPVTDAGVFILLSCSDPNSRTVAPHGGTVPRYSPNPLAVGIPTSGDPILIDISMSTTANGLCQRLADAGEKLPGAWLINREGQLTDDPKNLFDGRGGSILPLGGTDLGYKGFALGLFVEALTNALGGNGPAIGDGRWGASVFLQLINPEKFGGHEAFLRETSFLSQACLESPAPPGKPPVRLPGRARPPRGTTRAWRRTLSGHPARADSLGGNVEDKTSGVPLKNSRSFVFIRG
jgi:LDH2 family malate/lactate/ureidoglycolate dehydrogenase